MVAVRVRNPDEVKRGEYLIARLDTMIMESVQYNEITDKGVLCDLVSEMKTKLAVIDREVDTYRDVVGIDICFHECRRKTTDVSDIIKAFEKRAKWCTVHSRNDCQFSHASVEPPSMPIKAAPLSSDRSPMEVLLGEHVDMSDRFKWGCTDCPHAKDCFTARVCFNAVKEMVPEDTDSDQLKQLIAAAYMTGDTGPPVPMVYDFTRGSEDNLRDQTPTFDHCAICWERIPYGASYCTECYDAVSDIRLEVEIGPQHDRVEVESWSDG